MNKKIRGIAATNKLPTPDADIYKALCLRWKRNKIPIEIASLHIAVELSKNFHSDQNHYIVMKDVISEDVDLRPFILSIGGEPNHLYERIVFGSDSKGLRMQRIFNEGSEFNLLRNALKLFLHDHGPSDANIDELNQNIIWKILKSEPGCIAQDLHTDAPEMIGDIAPRDVRYSIILSIMDGTKIVLHDETVVDIPFRGMIMFRGDYFHAGAAYNETHYRVFVACYSNLFKPSAADFVGLV